jgi:hypothetical protein
LEAASSEIKGDPAMNKKLLIIVLLMALVLSGTSLAYAKGVEIQTVDGEQETGAGNWLLPYLHNFARQQPPAVEPIEPDPIIEPPPVFYE